MLLDRKQKKNAVRFLRLGLFSGTLSTYLIAGITTWITILYAVESYLRTDLFFTVILTNNTYGTETYG